MRKRFIDLFCGIGGFHVALSQLGCKCVFACDIDKHCREVYQQNYGITPHDDIKTIDADDVPDHEILCGGFPCQSFSNAGKKRMFEDERGTLFDEIIRIAKIKQPQFMILENVKHIKRIDGGRVFEYICDTIRSIGYHIDDKSVFELSPHMLGIPQERHRILFVCVRKDIYKKDFKPSLPKSPVVNFNDILESNVDEKYMIPTKLKNVLSAWNQIIRKLDVDESMSPTILINDLYRDLNLDELPKWRRDYISKNQRIYNKYKKLWDRWYKKNKEILTEREIYGRLEWQCGRLLPNDSIWNHFIQVRQSGIRVKKAKMFPTLVAIVQVPIYGKEKRYITPRECARLQSFPDSFIMHSNDRIAYKQFGNAVNVDVVTSVAKPLLRLYKHVK